MELEKAFECLSKKARKAMIVHTELYFEGRMIENEASSQPKR